ncbi:MAG: hypothetical protein ACN6I5_04155 [Hyphomicrobiales bacterium]
MTETITDYIFYEVAALLVLAAGVGFVGLLLRQPLIVSFIAVGIVARPVRARHRPVGRIYRSSGGAGHRGAAVPRRAEARP